MKLNQLSLMLCVFSILFTTSLSGQSIPYFWPMWNTTTNNYDVRVNSNFGDFRSTGEDHFHGGVDQQETTDGEIWPVWGTEANNANRVVRVSINNWVLLDHGQWDPNTQTFTPNGESSWYFHLNATNNQNLNNGDIIFGAHTLADGSNLNLNHLHFELISERYSSEEDGDWDKLNPLLIAEYSDELTNVDTEDPHMENIYVHAMNNVSVSSWNYPEDYSWLMHATTDPNYTRFETDWISDPHFLVDCSNSNNPQLNFVLQAWDNFWTNSDRGTPLGIQILIDNDVFYDLFFNDIDHDQLQQEEYIYPDFAPVVTQMDNPAQNIEGEQYYKLYKDNENQDVPFENAIYTHVNLINESEAGGTIPLEEGQHTMEISLTDEATFVNENIDHTITKKVEFYVLNNNDGWVDFSRSSNAGKRKRETNKKDMTIAQRRKMLENLFANIKYFFKPVRNLNREPQISEESRIVFDKKNIRFTLENMVQGIKQQRTLLFMDSFSDAYEENGQTFSRQKVRSKIQNLFAQTEFRNTNQLFREKASAAFWFTPTWDFEMKTIDINIKGKKASVKTKLFFKTMPAESFDESLTFMKISQRWKLKRSSGLIQFLESYGQSTAARLNKSKAERRPVEIQKPN